MRMQLWNLVVLVCVCLCQHFGLAPFHIISYHFLVQAGERQAAAIRLDFEMEPVVTRSAEGSTVRLGPLLMALNLHELLGSKTLSDSCCWWSVAIVAICQLVFVCLGRRSHHQQPAFGPTSFSPNLNGSKCYRSTDHQLIIN